MSVDNALHKFVDAGFVVVFQTARGGFHCVGHHHNGGLFAARLWTRIGEFCLVYFAIGIGIFHHVVEIARLALGVVRQNERFDALRQFVFVGYLRAIRHVGNDGLRCIFGCHLFQRIDARNLIFGETERIHHLADVVIECASTR